jgi:hypothetical protein
MPKLLHIADSSTGTSFRGNRFPSTMLAIYSNKIAKLCAKIINFCYSFKLTFTVYRKEPHWGADIRLHNIYKHPVCTSQKTRHVSATETNRLMLFGETIAVYCENHTEHINTLCGQNTEIF